MELTTDQKIRVMELAVNNSKVASKEDVTKVTKFYKEMIAALSDDEKDK